jgi:hypothetical protein
MTTSVDYSQKSSKPRKKIHRSTSDIDESDDSDNEANNEVLASSQSNSLSTSHSNSLSTSTCDVIAQHRKEILRQAILARMMGQAHSDKKSRAKKADNK